MVLLSSISFTKEDSEHLLGDLEEEYCYICSRFGKQKADLWYYKQVVSSFWPLVSLSFKRLFSWKILNWINSEISRLLR